MLVIYLNVWEATRIYERERGERMMELDKISGLE